MAVLRRNEVNGGAAVVARRLVVLSACTLAVAGCGSTQASGGQRGSSGGGSSAAPSATAAGLPTAGTITATVSGLGGLTGTTDTDGIAADGTSVWVYNGETGVLARVDEKSNAVAATYKLRPGCGNGLGCGNLVLSQGAVWVADDLDGTVMRVDAATGRVVATISAGAANAGPQVYATPGAVWVANYNTDSYQRIDPRSNTVTATLKGHARPEAVAYAGGSIWLCDSGGNPALTRLDPASNAVQSSIDLTTPRGAETFCLQAVALGSSVYAVTEDAGPMLVDTATGKATAVPSLPGSELVDHGLAIAAGGGGWAVDAQLGLYRLDAHTGAPSAHLDISGAAGIADDGHSVWVITAAGTLDRITPA